MFLELLPSLRSAFLKYSHIINCYAYITTAIIQALASSFTLLEDSGWYKVDYAVAESLHNHELLWGIGELI